MAFSSFGSLVLLNNIVGLCVGGSKRESVLRTHAIKYQVCCIENTVQCLAHSYIQYIIFVCNQCSKQRPLILLPTYVHGLLTLT